MQRIEDTWIPSGELSAGDALGRNIRTKEFYEILAILNKELDKVKVENEGYEKRDEKKNKILLEIFAENPKWEKLLDSNEIFADRPKLDKILNFIKYGTSPKLTWMPGVKQLEKPVKKSEDSYYKLMRIFAKKEAPELVRKSAKNRNKNSRASAGK